MDTTRLSPSVTKMQGTFGFGETVTPLGPWLILLPVSPPKLKAAPPIWPNNVSVLVSTTSTAALERSARKKSPVVGSTQLMSKENIWVLGLPAVPLIGIVLSRDSCADVGDATTKPRISPPGLVMVWMFR